MRSSLLRSLTTSWGAPLGNILFGVWIVRLSRLPDYIVHILYDEDYFYELDVEVTLGNLSALDMGCRVLTRAGG